MQAFVFTHYSIDNRRPYSSSLVTHMCKKYGKRSNFTSFFFIILLIIFSACGSRSEASADSSALEIGPAFKDAQILPHAEVLRDPTGTLSYQDVSSYPFSGQFAPHRSDTINRGLDSSAYWFRFRLKKAEQDEKGGRLILALPQLINELDLFVPIQGPRKDDLRSLRSGLKYYGAGDDLGYRFPALELPSDLRYGSELYLRACAKKVNFPIVLFDQSVFDRFVRFDCLFFGLITGILGAMLLYNLVLGIFLKDKAYAMYCIYIASMICYLAALSGWALWLGLSPEFLSNTVLILSGGTMFFGIAFSRIFLHTSTKHRYIDRIFLFFMGVALVISALCVAGFFDIANQIAFFTALVFPATAIACAAIRWRQGYRSARYYLIAWTFLFASVILFAASGLGLIEYSYLVSHASLGIGAAAESILLSMALADRVRELREERKRLIESERRLTELSITDALTGLYNKRWFSSKMKSEMDHARRLGQPLSLIILDVDHFKGFNDTYGHSQGDKVLAELGGVISSSVRQTDIPCRYGGEEFSIILPDTDTQKALTTAERLRETFASVRFRIEQERNVFATISLGVTKMTEEDTDGTFFERADKALYRAKSQGRNQSVFL